MIGNNSGHDYIGVIKSLEECILDYEEDMKDYERKLEDMEKKQ